MPHKLGSREPVMYFSESESDDDSELGDEDDELNLPSENEYTSEDLSGNESVDDDCDSDTGSNNSNKGKREKIKSRFGLDSQEVSIHRINTSHYLFKSLKNEGDIINQIIKIYNEPEDKKPPYDTFDREEIINPPELKTDEDKNHFQGRTFEVEIYIQKVRKQIPLLSQYGISTTAIVVNSLIFHYRKGEIFVLTTGAAWNAVQWCSDFNFPGKIAARILSKEGTSSKTVKGLIGDNLVSTKKTKTAAEANPFNLLTFCTSFTATIRENASILNLSCFASTYDEEEPNDGSDSETPTTSKKPKRTQIVKKKKFNLNRPTSIRIQAGSIRIMKKFSKSDFLSICGHLSLIAKGKETITLDNRSEVDSSAHEQYLTVVQTELSRKLDIQLGRKIHDAIADDRKLYGISNFELNHKYSTDFFEGSNFILTYKGLKVQEWEHSPPSTRELILALRRVDELTVIVRDFSPDKSLDEHYYLKRLSSAKLSYVKKGSKNPVVNEKIINFFQGILSTPSDNNVFIHVQSIWCIVQHSYLLLVQSKFMEFLKPTYKIINFSRKWPNSFVDPVSKVRNYVLKYKRSSRFLIPTNRKEENIVDMIKLRDNKEKDGRLSFLLYFIIPGLNSSSLQKMNKIVNFLMRIKKADLYRTTGDKVGGSEIAIQMIKSLHIDFCKKNKWLTINITLKEFEEALLGAKLIFAIGHEPETYDMSLHKELKLPNKITKEQLQSILKNSRLNLDSSYWKNLKSLALEFGISNLNKGLGKLTKELYYALIDQGLLSKDGSITGKFYCQTRSSFRLGNVKNILVIYELCVLPFQPEARFFSAKLELLNLQKKLEDINMKNFIIVEIPREGQILNVTDVSTESESEEQENELDESSPPKKRRMQGKNKIRSKRSTEAF